ncbi:hypothetical protein FACS189427_11670 [Planctomycetales bacterium]|nr:hypothetical protein FACS189427_11670 [Planctomycetales bacterium]
MYYREDKDILYAITENDIQSEAEHTLGRRLTEDELSGAVDGLKWGIGESISIIYNTIFHEMIPARRKQWDANRKTNAN